MARNRWFKNLLVRLAAWILLTGLLVFAGQFAAVAANGGAAPELLPLAASLIVGTGLAYWIVGRFVERRRLFELAPGRLGGLLWGLLLGVVLISVVVVVVFALGGLRFDGVAAPEGWETILFMAGFQAGIVEEILFRGILYRYVEELLGSWVAVATSALLFGFAHAMNPGATILSSVAIAIEAGILFAALYALTRNLWLLIGLHFAWNVTQGLLYDISVSGVDVHGWIRTSPTGSDLISGGDFGVEASLVTVVLLGGLAVYLLVLAQRRGLMLDPFWVRRRKALAGTPAGPASS